MLTVGQLRQLLQGHPDDHVVVVQPDPALKSAVHLEAVQAGRFGPAWPDQPHRGMFRAVRSRSLRNAVRLVPECARHVLPRTWAELLHEILGSG